MVQVERGVRNKKMEKSKKKMARKRRGNCCKNEAGTTAALA